MKKVFAVLAVLVLLFSAIPVQAGGGTSPVTVAACVDNPMDYYGLRLGKHLDLTIQGQLPNTDGLWIVVDEIQTGKRAILAYYGPGQTTIGHLIHDSLWSIRGSTTIALQPGYDYSVMAFRSAYTTSYPILTEVVWGAGVTMPTKSHPKCTK